MWLNTYFIVVPTRGVLGRFTRTECSLPRSRVYTCPFCGSTAGQVIAMCPVRGVPEPFSEFFGGACTECGMYKTGVGHMSFLDSLVYREPDELSPEWLLFELEATLDNPEAYRLFMKKVKEYPGNETDNDVKKASRFTYATEPAE